MPRGARPRPAYHLELIQELAQEVMEAQARLHVVVQESIALGSPYRQVARAAGMSEATLYRWHRKPCGSKRSRYPGRPFDQQG
jgi:DNA invertase Pin-like site-specific DNA recombinase